MSIIRVVVGGTPQATGSSSNESSSIGIAFPNNVTAGNLIIAVVGGEDAWSTGSITSSGTATIGTWSLDANYEGDDADGSNYVAIYSAVVLVGGSCTVTANNIWPNLGIQEYSNADTSGTRFVSQATGQNTTGSPTTTSSIDCGSLGGVYISCTGISGSSDDVGIVVGSGWQSIFIQQDFTNYDSWGSEDYIATSDINIAAYWWSNPNNYPWNCLMGVYKASSSSPTFSAVIGLARSNISAINGVSVSNLQNIDGLS
jgi:hypothetical protein